MSEVTLRVVGLRMYCSMPSWSGRVAPSVRHVPLAVVVFQCSRIQHTWGV